MQTEAAEKIELALDDKTKRIIERVREANGYHIDQAEAVNSIISNFGRSCNPAECLSDKAVLAMYERLRKANPDHISPTGSRYCRKNV